MNPVAQTHAPEPLTRLGMVVLALVIERPSHGYEIWRRAEKRFGGTLYVSDTKVYRQLRHLLVLGLIEEIADEEPARRPARICYRATARGGRVHRERIIAELREDPQIAAFRERLLSTGRDDPRALLAVIARMEEACLAASEQPPVRTATLRERLVAELMRARLDADLEFAKTAREIIAKEGS